MSKSRGNIVRAEPIRQVMGADALRYFLLREMVFGQDGNFSYDALVGRYNSDLANGLGNLASRTLTMIHQYRERRDSRRRGRSEIAAIAAQTITAAQDAFDEFEFSKGLEAIWALISAVDKFIVQQRAVEAGAPAGSTASQAAARRNALHRRRSAAHRHRAALSGDAANRPPKIWSAARHAGAARGGAPRTLAVGPTAGRPEDRRNRRRVSRASTSKTRSRRCGRSKSRSRREQAALMGKSARAGGRRAQWRTASIAIDDFVKVDLRVGLVLSAAAGQGRDKLLHMKVDIGEPKPRTIVAGIAEAYTARADCVGRKVVIVANLQPRKLRGIESQRHDRRGVARRRQARAGRLPRGHSRRGAPEVNAGRFALPSRRPEIRR